MLTLILQSLWSDFKKSWLNFSILFALWTICYFTFGFSTPSASIGLGLAFVLLLSVKLPIRSLKALSFCPADTKIKRRLLFRILNFDFLNFIWILLLVAEFALFKYASPKNILWFLIMSINILVTAYCIHSFLNSILSYETCFELQDLTERRPGTH